MSEIRAATEEEIKSYQFPEFGQGKNQKKVEVVWNKDLDVALAKYVANHTPVVNVLDFRDTPSEFKNTLALDSVKIMTSRLPAFQQLVEAGSTSLCIPVEEEVLKPGRSGGSRVINADKVGMLLEKEMEGTLTDEDRELMNAPQNKPALDRLRKIIGM